MDFPENSTNITAVHGTNGQHTNPPGTEDNTMAKTTANAATPVAKGGGAKATDAKDRGRKGLTSSGTPAKGSSARLKKDKTERRNKTDKTPLKKRSSSVPAKGETQSPKSAVKVKKELIQSFEQMFNVKTGHTASTAIVIDNTRSAQKRSQADMRGSSPGKSPTHKRNTNDPKKVLDFDSVVDAVDTERQRKARNTAVYKEKPNEDETRIVTKETKRVHKDNARTTKLSVRKMQQEERVEEILKNKGSTAGHVGDTVSDIDTPQQTNVTSTRNEIQQPEADNESQAQNKTDEESKNATDAQQHDALTDRNKENNKTGVNNPYRRKEDTPNNRSNTSDTWAQRASSTQTKIKNYTRIFENHDSYYEVSFHHQHISNNYSMQESIAIIRSKLRAILLRAKEIDRKAKINAWDNADDLPTITKVEDIPESPTKLNAYLSPIRPGLMLKSGRNNGWRVRITTKVERKEFVHYWSLSKRDFDKVEYVTLRDAPLQESTYRAAGCFINSGDNQIVDELEDQLSKELGFKIGIQYKPAALEKRAADELWNAAKQAKFNAPRYEQNRAFFKHAPFAQQVYAATRHQAHQAALLLSQKYGTPDKDLNYPRLPDGSRMRFIAASIYLDMQGRATASNLFPQQVKFTTTETVAPIPIRDPLQRFPSQGNKTMQQLLLDLKDPEMGNEPYFRHVRKRYHWNFKCKQYDVSIHSQMYQRSASVLKNLKEILTDIYGQEVGDALVDAQTEETTEHGSRGGGMSGISIATEDRYLNGPAKFIIEGLEKVKAADGKTLQEIRQGSQGEATMNIRSTTSGMTGNTGNTVPDAHESFADTRSFATPPDALMTGTTVSDTEESRKEQYIIHDGVNLTQGSKRNGPEEGWTVHGSAQAVAALAKKVATSVIPRGIPGGDEP